MFKMFKLKFIALWDIPSRYSNKPLASNMPELDFEQRKKTHNTVD